MKKGFSLIEFIIVTAIIVVLTAFVIPKHTPDVKNQNRDISSFFNTIAIRSLEEGNKYNIICDFNKKLLQIKKSGKIINELKLLKNFDYEDSKGRKEIVRDSTETGNFSKSFTIYTFYRGFAKSKLTVTTTTKYIGYIIIRNYVPAVDLPYGKHIYSRYWVEKGGTNEKE